VKLFLTLFLLLHTFLFAHNTFPKNSTPIVDPLHFMPEEKAFASRYPKYDKIMKELLYFQLFAVGTIGIIGLLPEDVSQWTDEDKKYTDTQSLLQKHQDNINKGPVWDNDEWAINYIGHPVAGSYFYMWGRESGLSWQESSLLTVLMSTYFWEYGWEAFAETPSTQDLIFTPLLGAILGEGSHYLYTKIRQNHGQIWHSVFLGNLGKGLLNPIGEMNHYLNGLFASNHIKIEVDYRYLHHINSYGNHAFDVEDSAYQSSFHLNFQLKY